MNGASIVRLMMVDEAAQMEWQAGALALIFFAHGTGNFVSLFQVISRKFSRKPGAKHE